jgi:hypothetical protein
MRKFMKIYKNYEIKIKKVRKKKGRTVTGGGGVRSSHSNSSKLVVFMGSLFRGGGKCPDEEHST